MTITDDYSFSTTATMLDNMNEEETKEYLEAIKPYNS